MKHYECANYLHLDCEKGMCALRKTIVPNDFEGSDACPDFKPAPMCGTCRNFRDPDKHGMGTCTGFTEENWAYAQCGAFSCDKYESRQQ